MSNITEKLNWAINYLKAHNIESPVRNAEILFSHILNCYRIELYLNNQILDSEEIQELTLMLEDRVKGKPLQYITGKAEFMGFEFIVTPHTFIPRPETEILVETVIKKIAPESRIQHLVILDLGAGCGNIAVSLTKLLSNCRIVATEISREALKVAKENARMHGGEDKVTIIEGDLFAPLDSHQSPVTGHQSEIKDGQPATEDRRLAADKIDIIVSNPPYIASADMGGLPLEVQFEPSCALDGGSDGLYYYRQIIERSPRYLKAGGYLAMEMGYGQSKKIEELIMAQGDFESVEIVKDLSGIDRVIIAKNI